MECAQILAPAAPQRKQIRLAGGAAPLEAAVFFLVIPTGAAGFFLSMVSVRRPRSGETLATLLRHLGR